MGFKNVTLYLTPDLRYDTHCVDTLRTWTFDNQHLRENAINVFYHGGMQKETFGPGPTSAFAKPKPG